MKIIVQVLHTVSAHHRAPPPTSLGGKYASDRLVSWSKDDAIWESRTSATTRRAPLSGRRQGDLNAKATSNVARAQVAWMLTAALAASKKSGVSSEPTGAFQFSSSPKFDLNLAEAG